MAELKFNDDELEYNEDASKEASQGEELSQTIENEAFNRASQPIRNKANEWGQKAYDGLKAKSKYNGASDLTNASSTPAGIATNEASVAETTAQAGTGAVASTEAGASSAGSGAVGSVIAGTLSEAMVVIFIAFLIIIFIAVMITAELPPSLVDTTEIFGKSYDDIFETIQEGIDKEFRETKTESEDKLLSYINSKYECEATSENISWDEEYNGFSLKTKTCEINVEFEPTVDIMAKAISAYIVSVDGTILWFSDDYATVDKNLIVDENNNIIGYDYSGLPALETKNYVKTTGYNGIIPQYEPSDSLMAYLRENYSNINYNATSEEFLNTVKEYSDTFFDLTQESEWVNGVKPYRFEERSDACFTYVEYEGEQVKIETSRYACNEDDTGEYFIDEKINYIDGYKGDITIPLEYDLQFYRKEELEAIPDRLTSAKRVCAFYDNDRVINGTDCTEEEANIFIDMILSNYYINSIQELGIEEYLIYGKGMGLTVDMGDLDPSMIQLSVDGWLTNPLGASYKVTSRLGDSGCEKYICGRTHYGVDFVRADGQTLGAPSYFICNGTITGKGFSSSMGNYYIVQSDDGYTVRFMHFLALGTKGVGDRVSPGDFMGAVGSTGMSTGAHLHIDIKDGSGNWKDYCSYAGC